MANVVRFDVGGIQYKVSNSLLQRYPNTMLAQSAWEECQGNPGEVVFLERDGSNFKYVLDYLRNNGRVFLQMHAITKTKFLDDLAFFGITDVDESKIV